MHTCRLEDPVDQPDLIQEDESDRNGRNVFHEEYIGIEQVERNGTAIGQLLLQHLPIDMGTDKDTDQHTAQGQHNLGSHIIQQIKEGQTEDPSTHPTRASRGYP